MKIAIDFDGTIVDDSHAYDDLKAELQFLPQAREALFELKNAGHILILWSGRSNLALRDDWRHNPLWALGKVPFNEEAWEGSKELNQARFEQMLKFVEEQLPGIFDCIDYGNQGKPSADLFIDDRALRLGGGMASVDWGYIRGVYGASLPVDGSPQRNPPTLFRSR